MIRTFIPASFGALALLAGCAVNTADSTTEQTSDELGTTSDTFVVARRDVRKCLAPLCSGYFVHDVNGTGAERYVSAFEFSTAGFDAATIASIDGAPDGEIVLKGHLGKAEPTFNTRKLVVAEAYHGLPGVTFQATDTFYSVSARVPAINCKQAPCPNLLAKKINAAVAKVAFDTVDVTNALRSFVQESLVTTQVTEDGALVAGKLVAGATLPGGTPSVLAADQVFMRVPFSHGVCPMFKIAACPAGEIEAFTRTGDLCRIPAGCVPQHVCSFLVPACDAGYVRESWTGANGCSVYACDPAFAVPAAP